MRTKSFFWHPTCQSVTLVPHSAFSSFRPAFTLNDLPLPLWQHPQLFPRPHSQLPVKDFAAVVISLFSASSVFLPLMDIPINTCSDVMSPALPCTHTYYPISSLAKMLWSSAHLSVKLPERTLCNLCVHLLSALKPPYSRLLSDTLASHI